MFRKQQQKINIVLPELPEVAVGESQGTTLFSTECFEESFLPYKVIDLFPVRSSNEPAMSAKRECID